MWLNIEKFEIKVVINLRYEVVLFIFIYLSI